jgi:hypothetical protein
MTEEDCQMSDAYAAQFKQGGERETKSKVNTNFALQNSNVSSHPSTRPRLSIVKQLSKIFVLDGSGSV